MLLRLLCIFAAIESASDFKTLQQAEEQEKRLLEEEDALMADHLRSEGYLVYKPNKS
jgi:hypothetical protein